MAQISFLRADKAAPQAASDNLKSGFDLAMQFGTGSANALGLAADRLTEMANEEAAFSRVSIDGTGLTSGARARLVEPARLVLSGWKTARAPFDRAIEPFMGDIRAARSVIGQIENQRIEKEESQAHAERKLQQETRYDSIRRRHESSQSLWDGKRQEHGQRDANQGAFSPFYWVALLAIGAAEWLINYDVFYMFLGVPAIAFGATAIMGVLLAFAAHAHGMLFKQWSYRFGDHKAVVERYGDWRMLGLATMALFIVLIAAGGSRYAAVMHSQSAMVAGNLAGADASIDTDPMRDVLLSLLANIAAWAVGVFIAYMSHDVDPDYMDATHQARVWERRWHRFRAGTDAEKRMIEARFEKRTRELRAAAESKLASVREQAGLLAQVEKHEDAIVAAVAAMVTSNAQNYNATLARVVLSHRGETRIVSDGQDVSPYDFQAQKVAVTPEFIRNLI